MLGEKILIFTATYNEKENISNLCHEIFKVVPNSDLLVIDDNSPDGTGKVLEKLKEKYSNLFVIHRSGKIGLGSAHKIAINFAINKEYNILVTMDADFSHDPGDIPLILSKIENADFVIGSRYMGGGRTDLKGYQKLVSTFGNYIAKKLLKIPLNELTTSFRAFKVPMLKKINLNSIKSDGYSFFFECLFWINFQGFVCREFPIHFRDRKAGFSKIPRLQILYGAFNLIRLSLIKIFLKQRNIN